MKRGGGRQGQETPTTPAPEKSTVYAVQCAQCFKWRLVPTKELFEDIRSKLIEYPWFCYKKNDVSCEDPADIEMDSSKVWAADKPNLPKTPAGYERILVLRKDFSKFDAYYTTPSGKRVRAISEITKYLNENSKNNDVSVSDFSFTVPKIIDTTNLKKVGGENSARSSKKMKALKSEDEDDDVNEN